MADLNSMTLTGRLVRDAEKKAFPSGISYLKFDVANNTGYGDYAKVNYFKCLLVGKRADSLGQYLTKGQMVSIEGEMEKNDWTDKDGRTVKDWQLTISDINLIGSANGRKQSTPQGQDEFEFDSDLDKKLKDEANARAKNPFGDRDDIAF
jgi:single-strand DNA-binding protein